MNRHVDEQTLAEFREGLLPARKAARVTAHLATCQRCADVDAQLAAVTTILARTPAPPMPASLAARLDAALAAEIARSAPASPSEAASAAGAATPAGAASPASAASPAGAPAPVPGEHPGRRSGPAARRETAGRRAAPGRAPRRLSLRLAAAAAAVVIVAGGGYAIVHVLSAGNTGTSASPSGASSSHGAASAPSASGRGPEAAPGALAGVLPVVASGTRYRPGHLPAQVGAVLRRQPAPASSPSRARTTPAVGGARFVNLAACVDHLARGAQPLLVDLAYYDNHPAAVIVVPGPGTANLHVWVVGPDCSAQGGDVIAHVFMPAPG